ncbi:MAG TPA: HAD family hydrolase [Candidatus Limnocylindrales bacterium]|nr:HAD family hydrolase [Candidatus Limnocylindrales bacterium]
MIAIGFDFDHTLGVDNGLERKAMYAYAAELGQPLDPTDAAWRKRIEDLLAIFRAGTITMDDMLAHFTEALAAPQPARAERWREICYSLVDPLVRPIDHARELLDKLRARAIPTAVLTNGWTPLQQKKIARALGPDIAQTMPILVSDALHAYKPDPAAFAALADALRTPRERLWYVGDNPRGDVAGALAAGLRAVWFDWENQSYPQDAPPPTLRIASLRELETLAENTIAP